MKRITAYFRAGLSRLRVWPVGMIKRFMISRAGLPSGGIHVFYGHDRLPASGEVARGGIIKFQRLNELFPNTPRRFNILYMVSSDRPAYARHLVSATHRVGAKFVWNQNGVAYPAWMPQGWEKINAKMAELLHAADYVFYQSEFARFSVEHFLGKRTGPSEVLHNSVDTDFFSPIPNQNHSNKLTLLCIGSQYHVHALETPIRTLALIRKSNRHVRLNIVGKVYDHVREPIQRLIMELNLEEEVTFFPPFTQQEAPDIFRSCDILLHTKIQDVCPGVVIEAIACGLPVVYSISGGVPELVGEEAGIGIPTEANWEKRVPPPPEAWAEAVLTVAESRSRFAEAARQRAVERFDLRPWIERHRQVFSELLG